MFVEIVPGVATINRTNTECKTGAVFPGYVVESQDSFPARHTSSRMLKIQSALRLLALACATTAAAACASVTPPRSTAGTTIVARSDGRTGGDSARFEQLIAAFMIEPGGRRSRGRTPPGDPLATLRTDADARAAARATARLADLRSIDTVRLSVPQRIDWLLLQATLQRTIHDTVLHAAERMPSRYLTLGNIYFRVLGERPPTPEDWVSVRTDLSRAPEAMALGRAQLREPPPLWVRLAVNSAGSYSRFLRGEFLARVQVAAPDSLRASLIDASSRAAVALDAYSAFLGDTLRAGPDGSWAVGSAYYDWVLRNVHFLPYTAATMIAEGQRIHAATRLALDSLASRIRPGASWHTLADEMRDRHPAPGQILNAYETASHHVQAFLIYDDLVYLPPMQELIFVPTPPELRETYAWGGYGGITQRDSVDVGRFFVTDVVPGMTAEAVQEKLRAQNNGWIEVIALHEGYPGHHLQQSYAMRNSRMLRHVADDSYAGEGWALYAEHWMARRGLFRDTDGQLAQLQMRLWRTARVIIDPSIHTGTMTYADAVNFLVNEVGLERSAAEAEVNRFTTWPTQAPSYIVGWLEIERMERELEQQLGRRFSERDEKQFVERVLAQGALPLALLRRAVRYEYGVPE